jgi:hypothetical protein
MKLQTFSPVVLQRITMDATQLLIAATALLLVIQYKRNVF